MPRAGLTTARVVEEAEAVADEVGLANLTLMEVANRLGVRMPSLYKHITGMSALQHEVSIRARIEIGGVLARASVGRSEHEAVQAISIAFREWARAHPGRYAATVRAPEPDDDLDLRVSHEAVEVVLAILSGYGIHGTDAVDATRAWRAAVHGFVSLEAAGGFGLPQEIDRSFTRLINGLADAFTRWSRTAPSTSASDS